MPEGKRGPHPLVDNDQEPEPQLSPETKLQDSKDVVTSAFLWMSRDVEQRLDALAADLRATDKPSFAEQLLRAAFRTALSAATAGASEFLAGLVVGASDALRETIKSAIENATGEALAMGAGALQGSREPLTAFIEAQKKASRHLYQKAQANWLRKGRHGVTTQAQADALAEAFIEPNVNAAAQFHYDAGRDAWITYLAQAHFGVRRSQVLDENFNPVGVDPSTNLASESEREKEGAHGKDVKTNEPDIARALLGAADGVMIANAELPALVMIESSGLYGMTGKPVISEAFLNGVNSIIRGQYRGRSLASAQIPRIVNCTVADGQEFTIRVNEKGVKFHAVGNEWLRARALVARPWNMGKPSDELEQIGLDLLLADLVPTMILGGINE